MSTFNIKQLSDMIGMVIPRVEAKVFKVWDRRTGEGQYGPYSFQDGEIQDETGSLKVTFSNIPDQKGLMGKTMIFKSMETNKGLKGLEMKLSKEYKGKQDKVLHINKTALIVTSGEEPNVSAATPSTRMPQNEPERAVEPSKPDHEGRKLGLAIASNRMTQLAGLYDLCWKTVVGMEMFEDLSETDIEIHKDIATTLFIEAARGGLADKMPVRTLEKFYKDGVQESPPHESQKGYDPDRENDEIPF